jgi:pregnancy-associated plasma protein-A
MNLNFGLTFFHFNLREINYRTNNSWARGGRWDSQIDKEVAVDLEMKRELRRGGYTALNIYFQSQFENETTYIGYATFPEAGIAINSTEFFRDGCNVDQKSLPGLRNDTSFNFGYTAVHETGHWLNLYHPFPEVANCTEDADEVLDTPIQATPTTGCPPRKKSCLDTEGDDNLHNIMDYSDDCCIGGFTIGQATRMLNYWYLRSLKI